MIDPLVGQTLGQYELHALLGRGGMAAVYRGFQAGLGRPVAVKVLPLSHFPDPTLPARFRREARLAANLMHPNIVPVYDFGEWQSYLYIVMALVSGGTLRDRLDELTSLQAAVQVVGQVADALAYAHGQGVFHRDVKPANVLLAPGDWAMLSDFGIARAVGETTRLTSPYGTLGTPAYMAPEQWLGVDVDGRADIYALGVMLYELLTGAPPFAAPTSQAMMRQHLDASVPPLAALRPDLPTGIDEVVQTALAKDPERRFRHASEMKATLDLALRGRDATSTSVMAAARTTPHLGTTLHFSPNGEGLRGPDPSGRSPALLAVLVGLLLGLVVVVAAAIGYILAGGSFGVAGSSTAGPTPSDPPAAVAIAPTGESAPVTATSPPAPPAATSASEGAPAGAATSRPAPAAGPNQPFAVIERRVGDYFAALNRGDYARAQAACCTPGWRSRYPLDEWRGNFDGVTDLRFATPFRYPIVDASRIVAEVDYSFVNSSGSRRYFTLRWTFVPIGDDWQADDAVAMPQR